jgi:hypothetical protein
MDTNDVQLPEGGYYAGLPEQKGESVTAQIYRRVESVMEEWKDLIPPRLMECYKVLQLEYDDTERTGFDESRGTEGSEYIELEEVNTRKDTDKPFHVKRYRLYPDGELRIIFKEASYSGQNPSSYVNQNPDIVLRAKFTTGNYAHQYRGSLGGHDSDNILNDPTLLRVEPSSSSPERTEYDAFLQVVAENTTHKPSVAQKGAFSVGFRKSKLKPGSGIVEKIKIQKGPSEDGEPKVQTSREIIIFEDTPKDSFTRTILSDVKQVSGQNEPTIQVKTFGNFDEPDLSELFVIQNPRA